jgi:hypothetical protein
MKIVAMADKGLRICVRRRGDDDEKVSEIDGDFDQVVRRLEQELPKAFPQPDMIWVSVKATGKETRRFVLRTLGMSPDQVRQKVVGLLDGAKS